MSLGHGQREISRIRQKVARTQRGAVMSEESKFEHFSRQLVKIGVERKKNLDERWADIFDCQTSIGFRHRDFKIQFASSGELEKSLGRKAKNRLVQMAGLVGYFGSFCRNYAESKKIEIGRTTSVPSVKEIDTTFEDALNDFENTLNNKESPTPTIPPLPYTPIVIKFAGTVDFEDRPSIVAIPQTSKALLGIYRTKLSVQRAVQYARDCGLIQTVVDSYAYGRKGHIAKKYAWNKVCEHQLRELMKKHGVLIPSVSRDSELPPFEKLGPTDDEQQLYYKVRLGKGMRTPGMTEQKVSRILSYKHRYVLEPMLDRMEFVNEGRPEAERLNFRFSVRITNGYNVKNGCRAYSLAGGLVKESKKTDEGEESFEEYFRRTRGDEPVEYDVKGSVPRINRLVNFGLWDEWNRDPYAEMFPGFCTDDGRRGIAKSTYMLYEFEQSGLKIKSSVARKCPEFVNAEGVEEIRQTMEYWYGGVWKWQGDSLGSLAFLYEDAAYSVVDEALKRLGYDFIRKFDCWVFPKGRRPAEKDFWKLVKDCVTAWRRGEYEREREELEFLENAGVREMKKHVF